MKKTALLCFTCFIIAFICSLAVCSILKKHDDNHEDYKEPNMIVIGSMSDWGWHYAIDNTTNVVYIVHVGYNSFGITVAYNTDGTVMSKDDIEIDTVEEPEVTTEESKREIIHPVAPFDNPKGVYEGVNGIEGYSNYDVSLAVNTARQCGYTKDEYPYWVREDGCYMLGDYIICAADYKKYPYGTIVETALGKGIVIDTGGTVCEDYREYYKDIDLATNWDY